MASITPGNLIKAPRIPWQLNFVNNSRSAWLLVASFVTIVKICSWEVRLNGALGSMRFSLTIRNKRELLLSIKETKHSRAPSYKHFESSHHFCLLEVDFF
jgi:hypothetical protein